MEPKRSHTPLVVVMLLCTASLVLTDRPRDHQHTPAHSSTMQLTVHAEAVLGMKANELQHILNDLAAHEHQYEPTNDDSFNTPLENFYIRLHRHLFGRVRCADTAHACTPPQQPQRKIPVDLFGREPNTVNREHFTSNWTHAPHLPRESINRFWAAEKHIIPQGSRCGCQCFA